jgi:hypothetical protein
MTNRPRALDGVCARCGKPGLSPGSVARPVESRLCGTCAELAASKARRKLRWGWVVVGLVVIGHLAYALEGLLAVNGEPDTPTLKEILTPESVIICYAAYCSWGLYWGVPAVWRWYLGLSQKVMELVSAFPFSPWLSPLIPTAPLWVIALMVIPFGAAYGLCGGAFYEYARCARVAGSGAGKRIGILLLGLLITALGVALVILDQDPLLSMLTPFGPIFVLIGLLVLFAELFRWRQSSERPSD